MIGPKEKRERALGTSLGLKGDRAMSPKSALVRKPYKPGVHGPKGRPRPLSEFGLQIREKRKFKLTYGVDDNNLKRLFGMATAAKGASGAKMVEFLERRLDNVIYRLGFAPTRGAARQLVNHGHITVNGKRVTSPGYMLRIKDVVGVRAGSETTGALAKRRELLKKFEAPPWLLLHPEKMEGQVLSPPETKDIPFEVSLLVESFSK
ncbi:MAG TPA: 30S ribosomal protein S4 [Candidatus Paceibacterota bacterium]|jgi:small subunit ribosomal protein S4|nr:30S ribosomal protein S4 [Candidatus Paceibacterota bacterium]